MGHAASARLRRAPVHQGGVLAPLDRRVQLRPLRLGTVARGSALAGSNDARLSTPTQQARRGVLREKSVRRGVAGRAARAHSLLHSDVVSGAKLAPSRPRAPSARRRAGEPRADGRAALERLGAEKLDYRVRRDLRARVHQRVARGQCLASSRRTPDASRRGRLPAKPNACALGTDPPHLFLLGVERPDLELPPQPRAPLRLVRLGLEPGVQRVDHLRGRVPRACSGGAGSWQRGSEHKLLRRSHGETCKAPHRGRRVVRAPLRGWPTSAFAQSTRARWPGSPRPSCA